ncbi:hypothetical protein O6H91_17G022600 [Diphasiastrum complanatum]|uniref:Uncharacterized protein n=1 Tax=Diphasiastrum complanatum TaxID=34168 RepID=A0ACC2B4V9_DIPCM|nr:hypothetical protein O6H91_17G022600 [Diphasiastrum complanatum]
MKQLYILWSLSVILSNLIWRHCDKVLLIFPSQIALVNQKLYMYHFLVSFK